MDNKYDYTDRDSIESYARMLLGRSLNDVDRDIANNRFSGKSKGQLGQIIEEKYFGYKVNNRQEADFKEAGVELKVSPIKLIKKDPKSDNIRKKIGYSAKERIVLSIIDYCKLNNEKWENNSLMEKCKELLLMFYLYDKNISKEYFVFKIISLWSPSPEDMKIIEQDWKLINSKVKNGKAHEISEGDTMYLGACTKGSTAEKSKKKQPNSNVMAQQRAFCYKRNYVDYIIEELLQQEVSKNKRNKKVLSNRDMLFDEIIFKTFSRFINKSILDIMQMNNICRERKAKNFIRLVVDDLCKKVFGDKLQNFEEFKKASIEIKTIVLKPNGIPKESMSFEQIDYCSIVNEDWEGSTIRDKFENKKQFWIIFKSKINFEKQSEVSLDNLILEKIMFWNMPIKDLEGSMHKVWEDTVLKIKSGIYNDFIKLSDDEIAHIRPKAKNSSDVMITPQGTMEKKKCFWLNAKYIKEQILKDK